MDAEAQARSIGRRLRAARLKAGLSQWRLGDLADAVQSQITSYESGVAMPSLPRLRRLAAALGLTAAEVLGLPNAVAIFSPAEAARSLGMAVNRVQHFAKSMRLGMRLGTRIILLDDDIERLRPFVGRDAGNPNFRQRSS